MPFSDERNALIKNFTQHQYKEYGSRRLMMGFAEIKWNKRSTDRRHGSGRPEACTY